MGLLKYQFDPNSNGDIVSSRDQRDPEVLKQIYEHQMKEEDKDLLRSREIASEIIQLSKSAPLHEVRCAGESYSCPILEVCDWWCRCALLGEKCFPVKKRQEKYSLELHNSMGAKVQEEDLCKVIQRYLCDRKVSYRFL